MSCLATSNWGKTLCTGRSVGRQEVTAIEGEDRDYAMTESDK
jgi:hypothetical protein